MPKRPWNDVYKKWKSEHPNTPKDVRRGFARGCENKLAHQDFLSALMHATALNNSYSGVLTIYNCEVCGGQHVGRRHGNELTRDKHRHQGKGPRKHRPEVMVCSVKKLIKRIEG